MAKNAATFALPAPGRYDPPQLPSIPGERTATRTTYSVNDMTIHRIVEQEQGFTPMLEFLPTLAKETLDENLSWLAPGGYSRETGNVVLCFQSYIVKTPHHNILVDSCIGNDKNFPLRPTWNKKSDPEWMNALKAADLTPEDIDFVMCTHLHGDHVGWNTKLENGRWVPTFPKARYLFSKKEYAYWSEIHQKTPLDQITDSVLPIIEANRAELVNSDHALNDISGRPRPRAIRPTISRSAPARAATLRSSL